MDIDDFHFAHLIQDGLADGLRREDIRTVLGRHTPHTACLQASMWHMMRGRLHPEPQEPRIHQATRCHVLVTACLSGLPTLKQQRPAIWIQSLGRAGNMNKAPPRRTLHVVKGR